MSGPRRLAAAVLLALLTGLAHLGCGAEPRPRNLLLVSLDTVRADHLGCYGYERDTSPNLDRLAAEGVLFEHATSTAPWTVPAHASLFSGLYPRTHRVTISAFRPHPPFQTLASLLSEHGFATAAFLNVFLLRGLMEGFATFELIPPAEHEIGAAGLLNARAAKWLAQPRQAPYFVFLHHYDAHSPYGARQAFRKLFAQPYQGVADGTTEQLKQVRAGRLAFDDADASHLANLYDAGIRQLDAEVGAFLEDARRQGLLEDTLVVITSDHGEEFREHGSVLHGRTLHQELVRVPLLFWGPGVPRGRRVSTPVSLVDVVPTVAALLGVPAPPRVEGIDLAPLWRSEGTNAETRPVFSEADFWIHNPDRSRRRALREGSYTLHYDSAARRETLYDLDEDPGEQQDLAATRPEVTRRLGERLRRFMAGDLEPPAPRPAFPEDEAEQLRQLGYLE